jgi:hypothetical protein
LGYVTHVGPYGFLGAGRLDATIDTATCISELFAEAAFDCCVRVGWGGPDVVGEPGSCLSLSAAFCSCCVGGSPWVQ